MKLLLFLLLPFILFAEVNKTKLINCYEIFEQRRASLEFLIDKISEEKQAFIALKDANMNLIKKREEKLNKKEAQIQQTLQKIENLKKQNEALLKKYQKILQEIKKTTNSKLIQSYAKMRAGNAAKILQEMDINHSLNILYQLSPKTLSKILSKMDSTKAAILSEKLQHFIPKEK